MLSLPDVTLVIVETREHALGAMALLDCERAADFAETLVFTDQSVHFMRPGRRIIDVPDWPTKIGWSRCFWYDVAKHVRTSHALCIQWDSWIVYPEEWTDEFLRYDYIGAPWWYNDGMNVGNGGFCLRSTKLMRFISMNRGAAPCTTDLDDDLYCRKYRPMLQAEGFEWAPEMVAARFALECVKPPFEKTFGFHACYNFGYGCKGDKERLAQRAELMARSPGITGTVRWKSFVERHPEFEGLTSERQAAE